MTPRLTLADLATGLDSFGDRYTEIDVFADDLAEVARLKEGELPKDVRALDGEGGRFVYSHHDGAALGTQKQARRVFTIRFDPEQGEWGGYDGGLVPWMKSELQGAG